MANTYITSSHIGYTYRLSTLNHRGFVHIGFAHTNSHTISHEGSHKGFTYIFTKGSPKCTKGLHIFSKGVRIHVLRVRSNISHKSSHNSSPRVRIHVLTIHYVILYNMRVHIIVLLGFAGYLHKKGLHVVSFNIKPQFPMLQLN